MLLRRRVLTLLVTLTIVAGGTTSASAQARLSHEATAAKLTLACDDANDRFDALNVQVGDVVSNGELKAYFSRSDTILRSFQAKLKALRPRLVADNNVVRALENEITRQEKAVRNLVRLATAKKYDQTRQETTRVAEGARPIERDLQQALIDNDLPTCAYFIDPEDPLDPVVGTGTIRPQN